MPLLSEVLTFTQWRRDRQHEKGIRVPVSSLTIQLFGFTRVTSPKWHLDAIKKLQNNYFSKLDEPRVQPIKLNACESIDIGNLVKEEEWELKKEQFWEQCCLSLFLNWIVRAARGKWDVEKWHANSRLIPATVWLLAQRTHLNGKWQFSMFYYAPAGNAIEQNGV